VTSPKRVPYAVQNLPFTQEQLQLFRELEALPPSCRFEDPRCKRLAVSLGLSNEFWMVEHVNGTEGPPRPWLAGHAAWVTCRSVRELLLEAAGLTQKKPRKSGASTMTEDEPEPSHGIASDVTPRSRPH
jgi:hypothetical protein